MAAYTKITLLIFLVLITMPLYASNDAASLGNITASPSFSEWANVKSQNSTVDEKTKLREYWKDTLGIDVFYLYFKAKKLQNKVEEKGSMKLLKIKGKPEIKENRALYIFKIKF